MTQGFIENNTKPDGACDFFNGMAGPKRAWFGMWDHVRGNDTDASGRLLWAAPGWFDEVDALLRPTTSRAIAPADAGPAGRGRDERRHVAQRDSRGRRRTPRRRRPRSDAGPTPTTARTTAPPRAARPTARACGRSRRRCPTRPTSRACRRSTVDAQRAAAQREPRRRRLRHRRRNNATLISRNASLVGGPARRASTSTATTGRSPAGHRIGVLVTGANAEWWAHAPTLQTVTVSGGSISLPFLPHARPDTIQGEPSVKLESYKADAPFAVPAATIAAGTSPASASRRSRRPPRSPRAAPTRSAPLRASPPRPAARRRPRRARARGRSPWPSRPPTRRRPRRPACRGRAPAGRSRPPCSLTWSATGPIFSSSTRVDGISMPGEEADRGRADGEPERVLLRDADRLAGAVP